MEKLICGFVLPVLLLSASLLNWSLISLVNLSAFLYVQFTAPKLGSRFQRQYLVIRSIGFFSFLALISHVVFYIISIINGDQWSIVNSKWAKLIGFIRVDSWKMPSEIYVFIIQILVAFVALLRISHWIQLGPASGIYTCLEHFSSSLEHIGSHVRVLCYVLLPPIQLIVGISHPSWASFPFFICSSVGVIRWSLTSDFLGLFWWWRYLLLYAGSNIFLLYLYQLPVEFPELFVQFAELVGLYKISANSEWLELCSGLSLLSFYTLLSWIRCDLAEIDKITSARDNSLSERLLSSKDSFLLLDTRSGSWQANILTWREFFQTFSINFFTYGFRYVFPLFLVLLLALSFWGFHFASLCSFGLLAYVGYIIYAFPSMFHLHQLNGLLLVFILFWAASTYVFNLAYSVLNKRLCEGMEIWETIGLWHYAIPGLYLLTQFCLGILVAMGNLVNNSVFLCLSVRSRQDDNNFVEEKEEMKVFIVATIAWIVRKSYRAIVLSLLFLLASKPGFFHAAYLIFFLVYLLSHSISKKLCRSLILLCEAHFALRYILHLHLVSKLLDREGSAAAEILRQLGLSDTNSSRDFLKIAVLACVCAIHNHGIDVLFSFSAIVQQTPFPPVGFSILRAGLIKSVLFSVYTSQSTRQQHIFSSHERRIMMYLSAIGERILCLYRSCGTYIAFLTILVAVYLVQPNYIFFGYLFFLLMWISGRQLLHKTTRHLWFPLKLYSIAVFIFVYSLCVFSNLQSWLAGSVDLSLVLGYDPKASIMENMSQPLAILISIQLFSYERRRSGCATSSESSSSGSMKLTFSKRLLIWHREKILYIAVLYASISPIGAFGFFYILGLLICSTLPKSSQVPSKLFLVYSGLLLMIDYVFQLWGEKVEMFPDQRNYYLSNFLGLKLHESTFWGLESGFRGKVVVIIACILQYNIFHWLDNMPRDRTSPGKWGEACDLFDSKEEILSEISNLTNGGVSLDRGEPAMSQSWPSFSSEVSRGQSSMSSEVRGYNQGRKKNQYLYTYFWESYKGSHKWNRRRIIYFRKERLHKQKAMLKIYTKYWIQNMFGLFGLEINMAVLLLASFAVLNAISLIYVTCLAACVVLNRRLVQRLWPMFVFLFASIVGLEYSALWWDMISSANKRGASKERVTCHECWRSSDRYFDFCKKCWFGIVVDDPRMLISYYMVFMFSCLKLKADHFSSLPGSQMYQCLISYCRNASLLSDLSFETKELWTLLDYVRHYSYCHLLDLVLALILITGTLEYDILHLGYLGFALVFFRMRLEILKKKNQVFRFLRIYNFALIVLSLAYQSPFIGDFIEGKCATVDYVSEVIGFYKYDYGFRITSRSALVEIVIFMLVSLQSFMFSSQEFDYVSKYLEAEQIGAIVRDQEKRASWKSAQLQNIRRAEEQKRQRNLQVEKMKSEMLNLQSQLRSSNTPPEHTSFIRSSGLRNYKAEGIAERVRRRKHAAEYDFSDPKYNLLFPMEMDGSPKSTERTESPSSVDSAKLSMDSLRDTSGYRERDVSFSFEDLRRTSKAKLRSGDNPLKSAVNLIGDGVNQVQSLGNLAVNNLVTLLNIEQRTQKIDGDSSEDEETYYEIESQNMGGFDYVDRAFSMGSENGLAAPGSSLGVIIQYMWGLIQSNNDVVCYCCFVLIFLWNFSLLSMVYLGALFIYALCVNTGPSHLFWVIVLIYSEFCIFLQYLYQIIIQHCGLSIHVNFLQELGFPEDKITSSFVISNWPLFLVYLFTLLQTSITASDVQKIGFPRRRSDFREGEDVTNYSWTQRAQMLVLLPIGSSISQIIRSLYRYWSSLTQGAETPPYFVQVSMDVKQWPEDGIQPERIESGMNKVLSIMHSKRCKNLNSNFQSASRVRIQSIERSTENPLLALAVFEVLHASPLTESSPVIWQNSLTPAADVAHEILMAKGACVFEDILFPYPVVSVIGGGKREIDLYANIFCADLVVFFLVAIFYQSIIKNNSEFLEVYQLEDQFPKEFVFILMVIFFLIVLDRVIYLCSFATGKVIFYLFSLALFTYSVTKYAWYTAPPNKRAGRLALRAIFLTKAVSLSLQAIQIRYGIPRESTLYRQVLTSSATKLNFWGFRLYRALPFLYELRCVLDWSCTTTSLTMYDWLKLEDIHASLFLVKCDVYLNRARHRQGEKQSKMTKFCGGICLFYVLICVIWAPMLMYSSGNPTNIANPIKDASVRVEIKTESGRLTLFETTLCRKLSWIDLEDHANLDPHGYSSAYNVKDIQLICCQPDASELWLVPPMVQARFIKSLQWSMKIIFSWELMRDRPKGKEAVKYEVEVEDTNLPEPSEVMKVLNGSLNSFKIYNVYPRLFRVTGSGDVRFLEQEVELVNGDIVLNRGNPEWWSFQDMDAPVVSGCGNLAGPMAIVVSEETPQGIIGETLSKFSIWGLYITFVLAVGRFIRLQCADLRMRIPFENLPSCERLLAICEDIYAARAEGELEVEEVLYWTLVKIYRSPHMLLEYTKPD